MCKNGGKVEINLLLELKRKQTHSGKPPPHLPFAYEALYRYIFTYKYSFVLGTE